MVSSQFDRCMEALQGGGKYRAGGLERAVELAGMQTRTGERLAENYVYVANSQMYNLPYVHQIS